MQGLLYGGSVHVPNAWRSFRVRLKAEAIAANEGLPQESLAVGIQYHDPCFSEGFEIFNLQSWSCASSQFPQDWVY